MHNRKWTMLFVALLGLIYLSLRFFSPSSLGAGDTVSFHHKNLVAPALATPHPNAPYPPSQVITNLEWASAEEVLRDGLGSDNWWPTWADDDNLYAAYGDGSGFKPHTETPMSLGFARISGLPNHFVGENIRTSYEIPMVWDGAVYVGGRKVEKGGGMLMVDGVLYMWQRNIDLDGHECKLGWSTDHALSWTYAEWTFAEFGFCNFVQFGKNYSGARDAYVYVFASDDPSAYQFGDDFILMRVPKNQMANRSAYEFFQRVDGAGGAVWNSNINQRGSIFSIPGKARRSAMSYNRALGRYIWWQGYTGGLEQRTGGSFGVYDAPQPWGPWTTVYYTEAWDMGVGDSGSFPTKWMSEDGRTINLAFSGADSFSVREAVLTVNEEWVPVPTPTLQPTATPTLPAHAQQRLFQIVASNDDAEERSTDGHVYVDSGDLDMTKDGKDQLTIGLRYQNVALPKDAFIHRAYLEFTATGIYDQWTNLRLYGEADDSPSAYAELANNITARARTLTAVDWDGVAAWSVENGVYRSPNLAPIVQELLARPGWQSGNSLAFMLTGYGYRAAWSVDVYPERAPKLIIDYTDGAPTATPTPLPTNTSEPTPTLLPTNTSEPTATATAEATSTNPPVETPGEVPVDTPVPPSPTGTPASTMTAPAPTSVVGSTPTSTPTPAATVASGETPTAVNTPLPTIAATATVAANPTAAPTEDAGGASDQQMYFYLPAIRK